MSTIKNESKNVICHVSDKMRSIDWFKKSFFEDKSAAGNLAITASRAVFLVTVIRSWVLKYTLKTPKSSSSVGFVLLLGADMNGLTLVAMEKLDMGLCCALNPPGKADGGAAEPMAPKPIPIPMLLIPLMLPIPPP